MIKQLFINYKNNLILLIIFSAGIFYRLYNANFEDYWFDEFFGFWISDPQLSFNQTLERSFGPGFGQNLLFDLVTLNKSNSICKKKITSTHFATPHSSRTAFNKTSHSSKK